ncbi:MAG TPA: hypothetical protein VIN03_23750 [Roseateles sp.]
MMNATRTVKCICAAAVALTISASAVSAERTMAMRWGTSDPNIFAYGSITFDDIPVFNGETYYISNVRDLVLTVTGTGSGDGTFHLSDFENVSFGFPSPLDFDRELIGQPLANGHRFGIVDFPDAGGSGTFTFCGSGGSSGNAPTCVFYFAIGTSSGVAMDVVSISPVPDVDTGATMFMGFLVVASRLRRVGRTAAPKGTERFAH